MTYTSVTQDQNMMPSSPAQVKQNREKQSICSLYYVSTIATSPTANIISVAEETSPKQPIKAKMASHRRAKHLILRNETLILWESLMRNSNFGISFEWNLQESLIFYTDIWFRSRTLLSRCCHVLWASIVSSTCKTQITEEGIVQTNLSAKKLFKWLLKTILMAP